MSGIFRVLLSMDVRPDRAAEFEAAWTAIAESVAANPASLGQALMRDDEPGARYHILTDWADEAAFRGFERSEAHVAHRARLAPYRSGVTMTTMRVVRQLGAADRPMDTATAGRKA